MLSVSSSNSFSNAAISSDTSGTLFIWSAILSSRSSSLIAKNLFCSSATSLPRRSSTLSMCCSTFSSNLWTIVFLAFFAAAMALADTFSRPSPFSAEISTTSQPSFLLKESMWILSPFFLTTSIMLTAITTGMPNSINCVERYRLRSRLVPSMMFRITSGRSWIR